MLTTMEDVNDGNQKEYIKKFINIFCHVIHHLYLYFEGKSNENCRYSAPCLFHPNRLQGRIAALLVLDAYVNICWEYEWNLYVHGGDVTASVHSLYRIKRTELRTFFSYNIALMTDLSTL